MKILSFNSGRGGSIAAVDASSGALMFCYEAEKDSFPKNASATMDSFVESSTWFSELPAVLARTGTASTLFEHTSSSGTGYFGTGSHSQESGNTSFFGNRIETFSSTHERAHIWAAYAMSPYPQGQPCYVLVLDDALGDFYEIDADLRITHIGRAIDNPCHLCASVFAWADRGRAGPMTTTIDDFGKLMGAASFGVASDVDQESVALIERILQAPKIDSRVEAALSELDTSGQRFRNFAAALSEAILLRVFGFAADNLKKGYPLIVSGEGALNSTWATRFLNSDVAADVFISPAANDAGCAIGTAVDAMRHFRGKAKLDWSVYSGRPFQDDASSVSDLVAGQEMDVGSVADALNSGKIIGWARGNCEIGKRALGNRSILAAPFEDATRIRINEIKGRASDCPVSPVCREEDVADHFEDAARSPYMLQLNRVTDPRLVAVRHVDGTARLQTVSRTENPLLHDLLTAFKQRTGVGVLCNTSLNFKGAGFINKTSDLYHFARTKRLDGFLAGIRLYWI